MEAEAGSGDRRHLPGTGTLPSGNHSVTRSVRGVSSARGPDSSFGRVPVVNCLGVVHMEEEVQDRAQVEVEREEQGVGETHGKEQGEEQRSKEQTLNRSS